MTTQFFTSTGFEVERVRIAENGRAYTSVTCDRCGGLGVFNDPRHLHYRAGGIAGGCFKCAATGVMTVRAYTAKQYAALDSRREKARAKRDAAREVHAARYRAEKAERDAENEARIVAAIEARAPIAAALLPLAVALADGRGGFCDSMARDLREGHLPRGRGEFLVCDIIAKAEGRRNSKAYKSKFAEVETILETASN